MGEVTNIEWTNASWNPWHGCHKVSPGCKNCYMYREKARYGQDPNTVVRSKTTFNAPLKWPHEPRLCFTCSWSDFFIEEADAWREEAYAVMRATPWVTYQVLTKRIERAAGRLPEPMLPNMWLGVSAESRQYADMRVPVLLELSVGVRFLSAEPLLGPLDLKGWTIDEAYKRAFGVGRLDWVIVGGESGPGARPMRPDWVRSIRDQCRAAGVAFFFKQWGEFLPDDQNPKMHGPFDPGGAIRVGKKNAGRLLDGRTWNEFPIARPRPLGEANAEPLARAAIAPDRSKHGRKHTHDTT